MSDLMKSPGFFLKYQPGIKECPESCDEEYKFHSLKLLFFFLELPL